ncbi:hypothetical protein OsI_30852 [Oryza sativa Indica Group]|uniref:Uncharacterized protein n=1 Tax=Oryza sativa subsp. indica TaxID=39946 RepID=B8BEA1_ORYSI|nr:hypothetical protein OsI_30852 [Oryza sativa Indica Group]
MARPRSTGDSGATAQSIGDSTSSAAIRCRTSTTRIRQLLGIHGAVHQQAGVDDEIDDNSASTEAKSSTSTAKLRSVATAHRQARGDGAISIRTKKANPLQPKITAACLPNECQDLPGRYGQFCSF